MHLPILLYHSVGRYDDPFAVEASALQEHLSAVRAAGWTIRPLVAAVDALRRGRLADRSVCLTFDDAYADFVEQALPVLERLGAPCTLFVPFGCLGGRSRWSWRDPARPILSAQQLADLPRSLVSIGSHSMTHPDLRRLTADRLDSELRASLQAARMVAGQQRIPFAYPYGYLGRRERDAAARAGYALACTASRLWGNRRWTDRFSLERVELRASVTGASLVETLGQPLAPRGPGLPRRALGRLLLDATSPAGRPAAARAER